jgi:hypothetical protein
MSLRLVRCPFCGKRFNVAGVPGGMRLKCTSCTAVLSVPRTQRFAEPAAPILTRRSLVQIAAAVALSLAVAFALFLVLRPSRPAPERAAVAKEQPAPTPPKEERRTEPGTLFVDFDQRITDATLSLRREFGEGIFRYREERPFLVAMERGERYLTDEVIKEYAARLTELYGFFREEFSGTVKLGPVDEVLLVVILASRESYDTYTKRVNDGQDHSPQIRGVYEFTRRRIVMYHDPVAPFEVILHEGVHQLVDAYSRVFNPGGRASSTQWFQEGLGTYFEGFRIVQGQIIPDPSVNRSRLPALKQAAADPNKTYTPLAALTGMSIDGFWSWFREQRKIDEVLATRKAQAFYAESWGLVYFLRSKGGPHRRAFDEYFRLELEGKGGKASFEQTIAKHLGISLEELEAQFLQYVRELQ